MFKKWSLLFSLLTLVTGSISARDLLPGRGQWEISGDFLYLMPSVDETYFVINADGATFPRGEREKFGYIGYSL